MQDRTGRSPDVFILGQGLNRPYAEKRRSGGDDADCGEDRVRLPSRQDVLILCLRVFIHVFVTHAPLAGVGGMTVAQAQGLQIGAGTRAPGTQTPGTSALTSQN